MSGLFSAIQIAGNALSAHSRVLEVTQNNLVNASTPGYARQNASLAAEEFNPALGLLGGVRFGAVTNSRSEFAESNVRTQRSLLERDQQMGRLLAAITPWLDGGTVTGSTALAGAFQSFYRAVGAWSSDPNAAAARQRVLNEAENLARSFRDAFDGVRTARQDALDQLRQDVNQVNRILGNLSRMQQGFAPGDAQGGSDASFYAAIEELSQYIDIRVNRGADGRFTITTANGSVLLGENRAYPIAVSLTAPGAGARYPGAPPSVGLLASDGSDLSGVVKGGRVGGLMEGLSQVFPELLGDGSRQGSLNRLAESFGSKINAVFTSGTTPQVPPAAGLPLFKWDTTGQTTVAGTIQLNPAVTVANLASKPSAGTTSIPAQIQALISPANSQDMMQPEGVSFTGYLSGITSGLNTRLVTADKAGQFHSQLLEQARAMREHVSGVSLEQEAVTLLQFQRSFEAITKVISVLSDLTAVTLNLVQ